MAGKIYVGNLSFKATEDELKELCEPYGPVTDVRIIKDRDTGRSRGFAFVELENTADAISNLNDKDFQGRPLRVNEAQERQR